MRARYAGVCSRTGRRYSAGTEIEKSFGGWAIAGSASRAAATTMAHVRMSDGAIREVDINRANRCGNHGVRDESAPLMERRGDDLVCVECGRTVHILSDAEVWSEVKLPNLYLRYEETSCSRGRLTLSMKVGDVLWQKIKSYFHYLSAEDLDDMDEFDMPGGWYLNSAANIETVEDLLGILPENRLSVREPRLQAEEAERRREEQDRKAKIAALDAAFPRSEGEYIQRATVEGEEIDHPRGGANVYGGGEWFV